MLSANRQPMRSTAERTACHCQSKTLRRFASPRKIGPARTDFDHRGVSGAPFATMQNARGCGKLPRRLRDDHRYDNHSSILSTPRLSSRSGPAPALEWIGTPLVPRRRLKRAVPRRRTSGGMCVSQRPQFVASSCTLRSSLASAGARLVELAGDSSCELHRRTVLDSLAIHSGILSVSGDAPHV